MKASWIVGALVVMATGAEAWAQGMVTVDLTPRGEQIAAQAGVSPAELAADIEAEIAEAYGTANVDGFLRSFANAASFSNRGVGVDYSSNASFVVGFGVNVAASVDDFSGDNGYPVGGASANLTLMAGINAARWGVPRLTMFANGFHYKTSFGPLEGGLTSAGVHAQFKLVEDTTGKMATFVKWGGVDVTGGLEYSRWKLGLERSLGSDFTTDGIDMHLEANGSFDVSTSALVLPVEVSTSVRLASVVSLYGGVGLDLQAGNASVNATVSGTVTGIDPQTNTNEDLGTATVTLAGEQGPSKGRGRALLGAQLHLWKFKLMAQLNYMPAATASVALGARMTW